MCRTCRDGGGPPNKVRKAGMSRQDRVRSSMALNTRLCHPPGVEPERILSRLGYHRRTGISARSCPGVAPLRQPASPRMWSGILEPPRIEAAASRPAPLAPHRRQHSNHHDWRSRPQSAAARRRELLKIKIAALFEATETAGRTSLNTDPLLMNGHHATSHALAAVRQESAISTELHTFRQIHKYGQHNQVPLWRFGHYPTFTARPDLFGY